MLLPVGNAVVWFGNESLCTLAESCLLGEVFLLLSPEIIKVLLMALVDHGGCSLEALPYLLAQVLCHWTCLAELLMQFLQLMECADDVSLISKSLGSLAQECLLLEILLEVILPCLAVELEHVVELLHIELIATPQLAHLWCGNVLYFLPLLLQGLELVVRLISLFWSGHH